jgi:enoyl-CoA hydratase/carnithine racemase
MDTPILFETLPTASEHKIALATLNSEKTLNSLNEAMIVALGPQLEAWAQDKSVACVILQGAGEKAFCAGGDIRALYEAMTQQSTGVEIPKANAFFELEYELDYKIHTYPKPILCLGHGIVMGGGLGLFAGSSHRIVSEKSMIAMPEISIGLYPDVGASWFLNRMPGRVGLFLGLTGTRMNAADALFTGLADYFVPREKHAELILRMQKTSWSHEARENPAILSQLCRPYHHEHLNLLPESNVRNHFDFIQEITDVDNIQDFSERLSQLQVEDSWIQNAKKTFMAGSPTSAGVIFDQLEHTKYFSLKECFDFEYRLSSRFAMHPDFREGIRALLIDKDNMPQWTPSHITELKKSDTRKMLT